MLFYMRNMFMLLGPHDSNRRRLVIGLAAIRTNRSSEIAVLEKILAGCTEKNIHSLEQYSATSAI